jgi:hypothetical protein
MLRGEEGGVEWHGHVAGLLALVLLCCACDAEVLLTPTPVAPQCAGVADNMRPSFE